MNKLINYRKKVALLVVEGLSANTNRDSSPLLPSNSTNIEDLIFGYEKRILKTSDQTIPNDLLENDIESLLNTFSSSKRALGPEANFEKDINQFKARLEKSIYFCKNHSSSLHLYAILSENTKVFNRKIFDKIISEIKESGVNKIYLHLFCDIGIKALDARKFIEKFNNTDGKKFQVSTISGISSLTSQKERDRLDIYKSQILGSGRQILDISSIDDGDYSHLLPHNFVQNRHPIGLLSDFDIALFLSANPEIFIDLIYLLNKKSKTFRGDSNLFQLKTVTLTKIRGKVAGEEIEYLIENKTYKDNLFNTISEYGLSHTKVINSSDRDLYLAGYNGASKVLENEELMLINTGDNFVENAKHIMQTMIDVVEKDDNDMVFASINGLLKYSRDLNFKGSIGVIDEINQYLPELKSVCLKKKITLVLASPFGGADKFPQNISLSQDKNFDNIKLSNVPLVLVNEEYEKETSGHFLINKSNLIDIISSKSSIYDFAPTILDLFNIDKPNGFEGRSLINV